MTTNTLCSRASRFHTQKKKFSGITLSNKLDLDGRLLYMGPNYIPIIRNYTEIILNYIKLYKVIQPWRVPFSKLYQIILQKYNSYTNKKKNNYLHIAVLMFFLSPSSFYSPTFFSSSPPSIFAEYCQTDWPILTKTAHPVYTAPCSSFFYCMNTCECLIFLLYPCHYCMTKTCLSKKL